MKPHNHQDCPQGALKQLLTYSTLQLSPTLCLWRVQKRVEHLLTDAMKLRVSYLCAAIYCPAVMELEIVENEPSKGSGQAAH